MQSVDIDGQRFEFGIHGDGPPVVAMRNVAAPAGGWPTRGEMLNREVADAIPFLLA